MYLEKDLKPWEINRVYNIDDGIRVLKVKCSACPLRFLPDWDSDPAINSFCTSGRKCDIPDDLNYWWCF